MGAGFSRWWITSAKSGECVEEGLQALVDQILEVIAEIIFIMKLFHLLTGLATGESAIDNFKGVSTSSPWWTYQ